MRNVLKQALVAVLFVVSASGGGHAAALQHVTHGTVEAFAEFFGAADAAASNAAGHGAAHHEAMGRAGHDHAGHDHADAAAAVADSDHDGQTPAHQHSGHSCAFCHAHCCAAAILASAHPIMTAETSLPRGLLTSAVPYGQRVNPPLRPPRIAA